MQSPASPARRHRLTELERANVFITPLDERREWYRYHHLLSDLLAIELERRHPDSIPLLHQQAAVWYAGHALPARAVNHAIAAGDLGLAAQVIGENYLNFLELGRTATLFNWLEALPAETIEADRRLGVVKAWTMHFLGRHEDGDTAPSRRRSGRPPRRDRCPTERARSTPRPRSSERRFLATTSVACSARPGRHSNWKRTVIRRGA